MLQWEERRKGTKKRRIGRDGEKSNDCKINREGRELLSLIVNRE